MKTFKLNKIFILLLVMAVVTSCVKDDDFEIPDLSIVEPNISADDIISITALAGILAQSGDPVVTIEETGKFIEGYVISSDEGGNFFKQLIIQDAPENPTRGVKILVDVSPLFVSYEVGRKVFVKLDGLTVGTSNGSLALGVRNGNNVARIPFPDREKFILRSGITEEIVPLPLAIEDFSMDKVNLFIRLNDVQFNRNDVLGPNPKTFAAEPGDQFDGERLVESCASNATTILSTSTFASFKGLNLPKDRGNLDVVLVRDFFDEFYTVYLNTPAGINFDNENRCDPDIIACEGPSGGSDTLLSQNFEGLTNINQLTDWVNVNVSGGSVRYVLGNFSNNNYAQISGFASGEATIESWFVTPNLNFDNFSQEQLNLDMEAAFDNGKILSVLITNAYSGDVTTTEWETLDVNIPTGPSSGFGGFQPSGPINISCFDGNVRIAFKYVGSDPSATTRYHLDNIEITGIQN